MNNNNNNNNNNIFNSITEIDDEEINIQDDNDHDEKIPMIVSVYQLIERYTKLNDNYHLSISSLLKIIQNNDNNHDDGGQIKTFINNNDISLLYFHKIFLPNHSHTHTVSII